MLPFRPRRRTGPPADLHRRRGRAPDRQARRLSWLRLVFWLRRNHRTRPRPPGSAQAGAGAVQNEAAPESLSGAHKTQPTASGPTPPRPSLRARLMVVLRLLLAALIAGCIGGLCFGVRHLLYHSSKFAVRQVRLSPTTHVPQEALLSKARVELGQNLFTVDLGLVRRGVAAEPWVKSVRVRRELPGTISIDVVEYQPQMLVALGALYLADADGTLFKRAAATEVSGLPVVTGLGREAYLADPPESQERLRDARAALSAYRDTPGASRPAIGEVHIEPNGDVTLYTAQGVAIRLGRSDQRETAERLRRFDIVWAALQQHGQRPVVVFLNNRAHPDHVTVRLASGVGAD